MFLVIFALYAQESLTESRLYEQDGPSYTNIIWLEFCQTWAVHANVFTLFYEMQMVREDALYVSDVTPFNLMSSD